MARRPSLCGSSSLRANIGVDLESCQSEMILSRESLRVLTAFMRNPELLLCGVDERASNMSVWNDDHPPYIDYICDGQMPLRPR